MAEQENDRAVDDDRSGYRLVPREAARVDGPARRGEFLDSVVDFRAEVGAWVVLWGEDRTIYGYHPSAPFNAKVSITGVPRTGFDRQSSFLVVNREHQPPCPILGCVCKV
jgi:hypothetical protein